MSTLSIRIDEKAKRKATKTLESLGLDMSSAVKMFLNQVVIEQGIPFRTTRSTQEIREEWDKEATEAMKTKGYKDAKEMFKALKIKVNV
jgi:DNA-damage-inducible protein J